jgi:hypothetical protein
MEPHRRFRRSLVVSAALLAAVAIGFVLTARLHGQPRAGQIPDIGTATISLDTTAMIPVDVNQLLAAGPTAQIQALMATVDGLASGGTIPSGVAVSLNAKLNRALVLLGDGSAHAAASIQSTTDGHAAAAIGVLGAFGNEVEGLVSGGVLPSDEGHALIASAAGVIAALSSPIDVTFTATPEFNDFLLHFSVTNNIGAGEEICWFGVFISSGSDIPSSGIPTGWVDAGGGTSYNNNWSTDPSGPSTIGFGDTLSGFTARDNDSVTPPLVIDWIAVTVSGQTFTGTAMQ